jgi:hypothetical protein
MSAIGAIPSVASSGLSGIQQASARVDKAASEVASASLAGSDTVSISDAARNGGSSATPSIEGALGDLRIAKYQNAASIAVLKTGDQMTQDLLKL